MRQPQPGDTVTHLLWCACETDHTDCRLCAKPIAQQTPDFHHALKDTKQMGNRKEKKQVKETITNKNHNRNNNINQTEKS